MCIYEVANLCFFVITCIFFVGKCQKNGFKLLRRPSNSNIPAFFLNAEAFQSKRRDIFKKRLGISLSFLLPYYIGTKVST